MKTPDSLAWCVHPLVFETGIPEAPHSVAGTGFMVGYRKRVFVVTARHALRPDDLRPLCIAAQSGKLLPLKDVWFAPAERVSEEYSDLAIVEVDARNARGCGRASLIDLNLALGDWQAVRYTSVFLVLGFPNQHSWVDYETGEIAMGFVEMQGSYLRPACSHYLHEIAIDSPPPLPTYSGFSGGPVFLIKRMLGARDTYTLCGMAVQGSAQSRLVRFIDVSVILDALRLKCERSPARS